MPDVAIETNQVIRRSPRPRFVRARGAALAFHSHPALRWQKEGTFCHKTCVRRARNNDFPIGEPGDDAATVPLT